MRIFSLAYILSTNDILIYDSDLFLVFPWFDFNLRLRMNILLAAEEVIKFPQLQIDKKD